MMMKFKRNMYDSRLLETYYDIIHCTDLQTSYSIQMFVRYENHDSRLDHFVCICVFKVLLFSH